MNVDLLYGRNGITVNFADNIHVTLIRKHPMIPLSHPLQAVKVALKKPIGCPPLADLAQGHKNACILICDITRPVPNGTLLPPPHRDSHNIGYFQRGYPDFGRDRIASSK
ncbi:lactate racemase domain-containing protein [Thermodesulfobacteriota bacterium]